MKFIDDISCIDATECDGIAKGFQFVQVLFVAQVGEVCEQGVVGCARNWQLVDPAPIIYL